MLTFPVRCVLLDLPTQLGDIAPPPGTARIIELGDVAQGLVALGVVLQQRELECGDDVAPEGSRVASRAREGQRTPMVVRGCRSLQARQGDAQIHARGRNTGGRRLQHSKCPSHSPHVVPQVVNVGDAPLQLGDSLAPAIQKKFTVGPRCAASNSHRSGLQRVEEAEWHQWLPSWRRCAP